MKQNIKKIVVVIILACVGGYLGFILNLPMGVLVGSFIAIATAKICGLEVLPMEKKYKQKVQMVIGGLVGLNLQPQIGTLFLEFLVPGLIATIIHLIFAFIVAFIISRLFHFSWLTVLTGSIPAGMSEISNIVEEINVDEQVVMLMHLFRVSILVLVLPVMIKYFLM